jgi:hypothetical protein
MSTPSGSHSPLSQASQAASDSIIRSQSPRLESENESVPTDMDHVVDGNADDVIELEDDEDEDDVEAGSKRKLTSAVWQEFKRVKFNGQVWAK